MSNKQGSISEDVDKRNKFYSHDDAKKYLKSNKDNMSMYHYDKKNGTIFALPISSVDDPDTGVVDGWELSPSGKINWKSFLTEIGYKAPNKLEIDYNDDILSYGAGCDMFVVEKNTKTSSMEDLTSAFLFEFSLQENKKKESDEDDSDQGGDIDQDKVESLIARLKDENFGNDAQRSAFQDIISTLVHEARNNKTARKLIKDIGNFMTNYGGSAE
jgi:hypothetical protein